MISERIALINLIENIRNHPDCMITPSEGIPLIRNDHVLPLDLRIFYELCGSITLFSAAEFRCRVIAASEFARTNPQVIGEDESEDRSDSWYLIIKGESSEAISIDLHPDRLGKCYDSFWDRHGIVGSCPVVALSFSDLLTRLFENKGQHWYWLNADFISLGDAYD